MCLFIYIYFFKLNKSSFIIILYIYNILLYTKTNKLIKLTDSS